MRILVAVLFVPAIASAQPSHEPEVSPFLYGGGNLRVAMSCIDNRLADGLEVTVDGSVVTPLRVNDNDGNTYSSWSQTDVGYLVDPGLLLYQPSDACSQSPALRVSPTI